MSKMTLKQLLEEGVRNLEAANVPDARVDAWLLLSYVFGIGRVDYLVHPQAPAGEDPARKYRECIARRAEHVPLQHITGEQEFMGFSFRVNEHVLIPRQDTEILVETVLENISREVSVLDMCTGSGCILLSVMGMKRCRFGHGADLSEQALLVARETEDRVRRQADSRCLSQDEPKISWIKSDLFENIHDRYDIIVSNPPYIPSQQIETLMPEVKSHEPVMALDGREDGLEFYRRIVQDAPGYLNPGGMLFFEIGWDQARDVSRILKDRGFCRIHVKKDLAGLDRVVYASVSDKKREA